MSEKKELEVSAIKNGTVIDHIPANVTFKIVQILDLYNHPGAITIGTNLDSITLGRKGIIKIADRYLSDEEIGRLSVVSPDVTLNIVAPSGYSFPSGHSIAAFSSALIIAVRERRAFGISAYVLAALIAFSRLYNYVHFPTDVLAGMAIGTIAALIVIFIFKKTKLDKKIESIGKKKNVA